MLIEINDNSPEIIAAFAGLGQRAEDLSPIMKVVAGIMDDAVQENFEQEGRPKWQALAQSTIDARKKSGHWPGPILQVHGHLKNSIEKGSDANSAWVGTNVIYAAIQQLSGNAGRGGKAHIPARPYLALADDNQEEILDAVGRFIMTGDTNQA